MTHHNPPGTKRLFVFLLCGFAAFGIVFTLIGAALPQVIRSFHWSYTVTGVVLAASAMGYFLATFAGGFLVQRIPPKAVLVAGLCIGAAGMALFVRWPSPVLNFFLNLAIGIGQGAFELVTNLEVIHMEEKGKSRLMNLLHASFCVGAIAGPAAVSWLLSSGAAAFIVFRATACILGLMAVIFLAIRFPRIRQEDHGEENGAKSHFRQPLLLLCSFMLVLYVGVELGTSSWLSEYYVNALEAPASMGAFAVSLFWFGIILGRLAVSFGYKGTRQEYVLLSLILLSAAGIGLILAARSAAAVTVFVFIAGLGYSAIYPLVMAIVGRYYRSGVAVGMVTTGGGIGSFTFPFIGAMIAQGSGIRGAFLFYLLVCGAMVIASIAVIRMTRLRGGAPR